jgi:hypothetical protein
MGQQTPHVVPTRRPRHDSHHGRRTGGRDALYDPRRNAENGDLDVRVETREEVHEAEVGAAELDVVGVCDEPHR